MESPFGQAKDESPGILSVRLRGGPTKASRNESSKQIVLRGLNQHQDTSPIIDLLVHVCPAEVVLASSPKKCRSGIAIVDPVVEQLSVIAGDKGRAVYEVRGNVVGWCWCLWDDFKARAKG